MEPTIIPAVSVALRRGDTLLLVRRGRPPSQGLYAFPGGRVEAGESDEEAARRELLEETGLAAKLLRPLVTLDLDGDAARVYRLTVFGGDYDGGEAVAGDDAESLGWYALETMNSIDVTPSVLAVARDILGAREIRGDCVKSS